MHKTLQRLKNKVKKHEKRNLTEEQQQELDAFKVVLNYFENKEAQGLALTREDEAVLNALEIIFDGMVKDSSIT